MGLEPNRTTSWWLLCKSSIDKRLGSRGGFGGPWYWISSGLFVLYSGSLGAGDGMRGIFVESPCVGMSFFKPCRLGILFVLDRGEEETKASALLPLWSELSWKKCKKIYLGNYSSLKSGSWYLDRALNNKFRIECLFWFFHLKVKS